MLNSQVKYLEIDESEVMQYLDGQLILLVTATQIETENLHQKLKPLNGHDYLLKVFKKNASYFIGVLGLYKIVHVQSGMGSISRDGSILTVSNALDFFGCKVVIMIGIAFGIDNENQKIGDVLISESVIPYDIKRVGKTKSIYRGVEGQSSQLLLNRFKNLSTWKHIGSDGTPCKISFTRLLSGESLVDNISFRNKLLKEFPYSKGGEMEGIGVYSACGTKVDWIIVKGICDFADGKKSINKDFNQKIASQSAVSITLELFNSPYVFSELGIITDQVLNNKLASDINDVLFDIYDSEKEAYYVTREEDKDFTRFLNNFSLWIYGPPGCGKTNLIFRNLIINSKPYVTINLAPYVGQNVDKYFIELLYELSSLTSERQQEEPRNFVECNKAIIKLLKKHFSRKQIFLFIEEIPITNDENHREFTEKLFSIIISKNLINTLNDVRFILSSIENPLIKLSVIFNKIHQSMMFVQLNFWEEKDIDRLLNIICTTYKINISKEFLVQLKISANGSPRFIKKFFRSIFSIGKSDHKILQMILKETERELKY